MSISIYALVDSRTGLVGYVGQSVSAEDRFRQHCREPGGHGEPGDGGCRKHQWMRMIRANGDEPRLVILDTAGDVSHAKQLESEWIAHFRVRGEAPGNGHDLPRARRVVPRRIVPPPLMGRMLREARLSGGLTQAAVGALVGVSDSAVSLWESGSREIPAVVLRDMRKLAARTKKATAKKRAKP